MMDLIGYGAFFLTTALIFSLITLGLNLQWGLTGLFNVGLAGFVAIGAYTSALLTTPGDPARLGGLGLPIVVGWLGAMVVGALAAALTDEGVASTLWDDPIVAELYLGQRPLKREAGGAA